MLPSGATSSADLDQLGRNLDAERDPGDICGKGLRGSTWQMRNGGPSRSYSCRPDSRVHNAVMGKGQSRGLAKMVGRRDG